MHQNGPSIGKKGTSITDILTRLDSDALFIGKTLLYIYNVTGLILSENIYDGKLWIMKILENDKQEEKKSPSSVEL